MIVAQLVLLALMNQAPAIKNPTGIEFECVDHAQDTGHEVDIVGQDGKVVQTLQVGDPEPVGVANGNPLVRVTLNVQPVTFGSYTFVVRAVAGTVKSDNSVPSDAWERVPGAPGKSRALGGR